jgi:hypothetical protein
VDGERVVCGGELPVLEQPLDRRTAKRRRRPARQVPDFRVPVPLSVEPVVRADVASQLDPLAAELSGSILKPHDPEYTGFGNDTLCRDFTEM